MQTKNNNKTLKKGKHLLSFANNKFLNNKNVKLLNFILSNLRVKEDRKDVTRKYEH